MQTYRNERDEKLRVTPYDSDHALVYSGTDSPDKLSGEAKLTIHPIRILMEYGYLPSNSRIDLGRLDQIKYGIKVRYRGRVHPNHLQRLFQDQKAITEKNDTSPFVGS